MAGRAVGSVSFSFAEQRLFTDEDRALLAAIVGQASLALERRRLLESERRARLALEDQAREQTKLLEALEASEDLARTRRAQR